MPEDLLSYQPTLPTQPTGLRTAVWVYLLVLAIFYGLGGLCVGGSGVIVVGLMFGTPLRAAPILYAVFGGITLLMLGMGVTYLMTSLRIRRNSRTAAVVALERIYFSCTA